MNKRLSRILNKSIDLMKTTKPSEQKQIVEDYLKSQNMTAEELVLLMEALVKL